MSDPDFDVTAAHRWFAIEGNNETWTWLDTNDGGDRTDPIIHAAHSSYYHWTKIGTVINRARAASLVANVHAFVGNGELSHALALECLELTAAAGDAAQDWDVAFANDSLARALTALGRDEASEQWTLTRSLGDAIADPADKEVFDSWFNRRT